MNDATTTPAETTREYRWGRRVIRVDFAAGTLTVVSGKPAAPAGSKDCRLMLRDAPERDGGWTVVR